MSQQFYQHSVDPMQLQVKLLKQRKWLWICTWTYLILVVLYLLGLKLAGDRWWWGTVLLYAPRWPSALPLLLLVPCAIRMNKLALIPSVLCSLLVLGPILGVNVPPLWGKGMPGTNSIRVMTFNVNGMHFDINKLHRSFEIHGPDVVAFQEFSSPEIIKDLFPKDRWHCEMLRGGLFIASRFPISSVEQLDDADFGFRGYAARCKIKSEIGWIGVGIVHLPTPRDGMEGLARFQLSGMDEAARAIATRRAVSIRVAHWLAEVDAPLLILGDFNLTCDSHIYQTCWGTYSDAFEKKGLGYGYSKYTRWHGVRIDHILMGNTWRCLRCEVAADCGSDHLPILADVYLVNP